jgi:hypothetical protein
MSDVGLGFYYDVCNVWCNLFLKNCIISPTQQPQKQQ